MKHIHIIGGGLAGPEAALQAASLGCKVTLSEMRPLRSTEAHQTSDFAELVCSNSLKSESENSAPWLLKQEMRRANSFLLQAADKSAVPAGHALAVDREVFSREVAALIAAQPLITVLREEVTTLNENDPNTITILASGPLTSSPLAQELQRLTGADHLAFYDSISPIVDASTIDMDKVYYAARWDKGTADYINCPFTKEEYEAFIEALATAEKIEQKSWEALPSTGLATESSVYSESGAPASDSRTRAATTSSGQPREAGLEGGFSPPFGPGRDLGFSPGSDATTPPTTNHQQLITPINSSASANLQYFEGCLPIEETARRGRDTLRFGPMKPAGLTNPKTGRWPYAAVQLRQENLRADSYNLVGFQNSLKYGEQARVLRMIPGLENAKFLRYGQIHRNNYIHAPSLLTETLQLKQHPGIMIAGQLSGVEGYTESIASGLLAGRYAAALARGEQPTPAPRLSANGSLTHYITHADPKKFQPANITFDLLVPLEEDLRKRIRDKKERHRIQCERALEAWTKWLEAAP